MGSRKLSVEVADVDNSAMQNLVNEEDAFHARALKTIPMKNSEDIFGKKHSTVTATQLSIAHSGDYEYPTKARNDRRLESGESSDRGSASSAERSAGGTLRQKKTFDAADKRRKSYKDMIADDALARLPAKGKDRSAALVPSANTLGLAKHAKSEKKTFSTEKRKRKSTVGRRSVSSMRESSQGHSRVSSQQLSAKSPLPSSGDEGKLEAFYAGLDTAPRVSQTTATEGTNQPAIPERAEKNCLYKLCFIIASHHMFTVFITLLIILNTVVLATDSYPENEALTTEAEMANSFFTWCFAAEMIIKLLGLGVKEYTRDGFNLFDAAVVILSMIEIAIE